jgi:hypothetical protein
VQSARRFCHIQKFFNYFSKSYVEICKVAFVAIKESTDISGFEAQTSD